MHGPQTQPASASQPAIQPRRPATPRPLALALLAALVTALLVGLGGLAAAPARADAPLYVPERLTDLTADRVLTDGSAAARQAMEELEAKGTYRLWAVYVDSFDGTDAWSWVDQSAQLSQLGSSDLLLAVAVDDGAYATWAGDDISDSLWDRVDDAVVSALGRADSGSAPWSEAVVVAANTLASASGGSGAGGWVFVLVLVAIAVVVIIAVSVSKKKKGGKGAGAQSGGVPTQELVQRSGTALVAIDDELRSFEEELGFAEAQFGSDATGQYTQVLAESKARVSRAFALRKQLDSTTDDAQRRALATDILASCDQVSEALQRQGASFEMLRQEQANAPQRISALTGRAEEISRKIPGARATIDALRAQYPATSLESVSGNPDQAQRLIEGAAGALQKAQQELAAQDSGAAVGQIRVAETALGQAKDLLAAVDRARDDLAAAGPKIQAASASLTSDIADARRLAPGDSSVSALVSSAQGAIAQAATATGPQGDPLAALSSLADAEMALDSALAPYREQADVSRRAQAQVGERSARLDSTIRGVNDYIASRRGAVGPEARTELAEAIRLYGLSQQLAATDPPQALGAIQVAEQHAARAQQLAQRDVNSWESQQRRGGGGRGGGGMDLGSFMLGGLMAGGGRRRNSWGGNSWGGGSSWGAPRGGSTWGSPGPSRGSSRGGSSGGSSRGGSFGGGSRGGSSRGGGRSSGGGRSRGGRF